jgi:hypothetical protein
VKATTAALKLGWTKKKIREGKIKADNFRLVKLSPSVEAGMLSIFRALPSKKG